MLCRLEVALLLQVYIRPGPLPELPQILFLLLYSLHDAYSFQRRLALLERRDAKEPDAVALSCGVATLLQQFHPSYAEVTLDIFTYPFAGPTPGIDSPCAGLIVTHSLVRDYRSPFLQATA